MPLPDLRNVKNVLFAPLATEKGIGREPCQTYVFAKVRYDAQRVVCIQLSPTFGSEIVQSALQEVMQATRLKELWAGMRNRG
jgi:hypothetical protein